MGILPFIVKHIRAAVMMHAGEVDSLPCQQFQQQRRADLSQIARNNGIVLPRLCAGIGQVALDGVRRRRCHCRAHIRGICHAEVADTPDTAACQPR